MPGVWPLTGREEELRIVREMLDRPPPAGIVIAAPSGVGKTRLAREVLARERARRVYWTAATESSRSIPLSAFAEVAGKARSDPLTRVRDVFDALVGTEADTVLVGVDDAHLLDDASAFVVHQLVLRHRVAIVLTVRSGESCPDAVTRACKDVPLSRLDLEPLTEDATRRLVEGVLGGPVATASARQLWSYTRGNVLYLHQLVEDDYASGRLAQSDGMWEWAGMSGLSPTLVELVETQVGRQPRSVQEVLDALAVCEPLELTVMRALVDPEALPRAEAAGLIVVGTDTEIPTIRLSHPLIGEARRAHAGELRLRETRGRIATALADHEGGNHWSVVRRALLVRGSDLEADPAMLLDAARVALTLHDAVLCEELAGAAVEAGGGPEARLMHAFTLGQLERSAEADGILAELMDSAPDDTVRFRVALVRAGNLAWVARDAVRAQAVLDDSERLAERLGRGAGHRALRSAVAVIRGQCSVAVDLARNVLREGGLDDYETMMAIWGLVAGLGDLGRTGSRWGRDEFGSVRSAAAVGYAVAARSGAAEHLRMGLGFLELSAEVAAGSVDDACAVVDRLYERDIDLPHAVGIEFMVGTCELARGRLDAARARLGDAVYGSVRNTGPALLSATYLATALAMSGRPSEAAEVLSDTDVAVRVGPGFALWDQDIAVAEGWVRAAGGALGAAVDVVRAAAAAAGARGQVAREVQCIQAATQFGDATTAPRARHLAGVVEGPRAGAVADHAEGLAARDGNRLAEVSYRYEELGDLIAALDSAAQAVVALRRGGHRGAALTAYTRARSLAERCGGADTPALQAASEPVSFTGREHEVVRLAIRGLSNREIAEILVVSIRTVEGHLYRIYRKVGASSRDELAKIIRGSAH